MQEPVDMNVGFPYRVLEPCDGSAKLLGVSVFVLLSPDFLVFSGIKDFLGSLKLILDEFALNLLDFGDDLQNNAERCEHQQNDSQ